MENPLEKKLRCIHCFSLMLTFPEMYISFSGLMSHHVLTVLRIIYTPGTKETLKKLTSLGLIKGDVMS